MHPQDPAPAVSPVLIFETMNAYQRTSALKAAIELDVFTAIGEGATTPTAIASRCEGSRRGLQILCDFLTINGLLEKNNETYSLTRDTAVFLNRKSPAYMGSAIRFLNSGSTFRAFDSLAESLRTGRVMVDDGSVVEPENPAWVDFAETMENLHVYSAQAIAARFAGAGPIRVLDVAAGHGAFGISIAKRNPQAEIVALDWASVLEVAKRNAAKASLNGRFRTIPGDAFQVDYGTGYDAVLITNFLHHFSPARNEEFLRKVNAALRPGGEAVALDFVPNEDRVTPPVAASFAMTMLATTPEGNVYTASEYRGMFMNAGFTRFEVQPIPQSPQMLVIARKP